MTPDVDITSGFDTNFLPNFFVSATALYLFVHLSKNPLKDYFYNIFPHYVMAIWIGWFFIQSDQLK